MQFSEQRTSRIGLLMLGAAIVSLTACTVTGQPSSTSSNRSTPSASPATSSTSTQAKNEPSAPHAAKGTPKDQFVAILGTKQDGWLPRVLVDKGLKRGMTPAAAGKIFPGAEKVSEFGFSKVAAKDSPGLKQYEFYYAKDGSGQPTQLSSIKLHFEPGMNEAYSDLVDVASNKYGAAKPEEVQQQTIVWIGPDFATVQLTKSVTDFGGYELNVDLEKE